MTADEAKSAILQYRETARMMRQKGIAAGKAGNQEIYDVMTAKAEKLEESAEILMKQYGFRLKTA